MKTPKPIYLDNHATTPLDPRVLQAMLPYFKERFGNAASRTHAFGRQAEDAVINARHLVAKLIGAEAREIIFTSGATESNNLAIKGVAEAYKKKGNHIVTVVTEHKSVLDPCKRLEQTGLRVTYLPVRRDGLLDLNDLKKALTKKTILISVMFANNEIGVLQPIAAIGRIAKAKGILFHCDAAQALGKVPLDVKRLGVDLLSMTAHKIYGPKGVGALYVRKGKDPVRLIPLFDGGGHEVGMRSGTLNVPGIVGFGKACQICQKEMRVEVKRLVKMRDLLRKGILSGLDGCCRINGSLKYRLPNNLNVGFRSIQAEQLLKMLPEFALSSGSACLSTSPQASHVLRAIGLSEEEARCSIRFGVGRFNTRAEVARAIKCLVSGIRSLKTRP